MSNKKKILIVDDDTNIIEVLYTRLSASDFDVVKANCAASAIKILRSDKIDLMISDMKMPGKSGMDLFTEIQPTHPDLPVIFLTAYGTIPEAVNAVKAGALDYLAKPFDGKELVKKVNKILLRKNKSFVNGPPSSDDDFYWGKSPAMKELQDIVERVAASHVNVLILGESGVGKECIARFIHTYSERKKHPYVIVDCGSTPSGLLESELFGHVKGSFTHAVANKTGLIEAANKGTLFLDEIGNISQEMQSRLLRFLEDKRIRAVGSIKETPIDCRVVSATNADLLKDIQSGQFRQDLYFRLRVVTVNVPSLKNRREDIPELTQLFVKRYCTEHGIERVSIPPKTMKWLSEYPWPGNVRELKNSIEAGIVLCRDNTLHPSDIQLAGLPVNPSLEQETEDSFSIEESEKKTIIRALKETRGVQKDAADLLNISKRSIHYKIKKYNIKSSEYH